MPCKGTKTTNDNAQSKIRLDNPVRYGDDEIMVWIQKLIYSHGEDKESKKLLFVENPILKSQSTNQTFSAR